MTTVVEHLKPMRIGSRKLPFPVGVRVNDLLFVSGQIGNRDDGTLPEGIEAQTRQVLENVRAILATQACDLEDLVQCTVMLRNIDDWEAFNAVYESYFTEGCCPARAAFGVSGLALGALVELQCQAVVSEH